MKMLITGGGGFLAVRLAEKLIELGHEVRVLLHSPKVNPYLDRLHVERFFGDIVNKASLVDSVKGCDVIFHTAGLISYSRNKNSLMYETNVIGTKNIAELALEYGIKRFVYTSSISALGVNYNPEVVMDEAHEFNAEALEMGYFTSKYLAEKELHKFKSKGLDYVIVNPGSIIGPRDTRKKGQAYVALIYKLNPCVLLPGGNNFVDVDCVVDGHIAAWQKGRTGERYILGGENLRFSDFIRKTNRIIGRSSPKFSLPPFLLVAVSAVLSVLNFLGLKTYITPVLLRQIGYWYLFVDSSKAARELGYKVKPIDEAVQSSLIWLRENNYIR